MAVNKGLVLNQASKLYPPQVPKAIMPSISKANPEYLAKPFIFVLSSSLFFNFIANRSWFSWSVHLAVTGKVSSGLNGQFSDENIASYRGRIF